MAASRRSRAIRSPRSRFSDDGDGGRRSVTRILVLRHGESEGNAERRLQGNVAFPLTELGRQQGRALAARVAAEGADVLYTSPAPRARETAELVAQATALPLGIIEGVREYDFGDVSGLTMTEVAALHPQWATALREGREPPPLPGEEGRSGFRERVMAAFWQIAERHPDERVALVTHSAVIGLICQQIMGVRSERPLGFITLDNCSITVIDVAPAEAMPPGLARAVIVTLNDACHIRE